MTGCLVKARSCITGVAVRGFVQGRFLTVIMDVIGIG